MSPKLKALVAAGASAAAIAAFFVPEWEGYSPKAYRDSAKIWTICTGHTGGVRPGQVATTEECQAFLQSDMGTAFKALDRRVFVKISEPTRAALASFVYNVGEGAFATSGVLRKLNGGDIRGACDELVKWVYVTVGGQKVRLRGLENRREAERELCLLGVEP
ncbi:lysozyme [Alphaproteobacteria bacterium]|nr:lysozyme [Alphaproteobacteria bacterium]